MISMEGFQSVLSQDSKVAPELSPLDVTLAGLENRLTTPLACTTCRGRHLKCDGQTPCSRCKVDGVECMYVKSRRGYRGPRKVKRNDRGSSPHDGRKGESGSPEGTSQSGGIAQLPLPGSFPPTSVSSKVYIPLLAPAPTTGLLAAPPVTSPFEDSEISSALAFTTFSKELGVERWPAPLFLSAFFEHFHACHPFLPPRPKMLELIRSRNLPHLVLAMLFIGSFYYPSTSTTIALDAVTQAMRQMRTKDGFYVQAMLLLAIGLQTAEQTDQAGEVLASATDLAVELGMHRREYAWVHGDSSREIEECWRRTWWEIYVLGALLGATNSIPFSIYDIDTDCLLPCEEHEYLSGDIPPPKALTDLDDSDFLGDNEVFSSFAYRIDAARRCGFALKAVRRNPICADTLQIADIAIANWYLQLPETKRECVDRGGNIDEMMFQAQMIAAACQVLLEIPRSDLLIDTVVSIKTCVSGIACNFPGDRRNVHTANALSTANKVSKLMLLPTPLFKHTPLFSCITTMASVVYLSYWSLCAIDGSDTFTKEQIKLAIGTLKKLSELWPVARKTLAQVRGVAQELYAARRAINSLTWDAMTRGMIADVGLELSMPLASTYNYGMGNGGLC